MTHRGSASSDGYPKLSDFDVGLENVSNENNLTKLASLGSLP